TSPSGIFFSSARGGFVWAVPAVGSIMTPRRRNARANITPSALGDVDVGQRRLQSFCELLGVVICPEVQRRRGRAYRVIQLSRGDGSRLQRVHSCAPRVGEVAQSLDGEPSNGVPALPRQQTTARWPICPPDAGIPQHDVTVSV